MKTAFVILASMFFSMSTLSAKEFGEEKNKTKQNPHASELKNLFNQRIEGLNQRGSVIALVRIDKNGFGKVIESNASTPELEKIVIQQVESKQFKNIKDDLIKLKVEFKK
jgi:hypothetical protein